MENVIKIEPITLFKQELLSDNEDESQDHTCPSLADPDTALTQDHRPSAFQDTIESKLAEQPTEVLSISNDIGDHILNLFHSLADDENTNPPIIKAEPPETPDDFDRNPSEYILPDKAVDSLAARDDKRTLVKRLKRDDRFNVDLLMPKTMSFACTSCSKTFATRDEKVIHEYQQHYTTCKVTLPKGMDMQEQLGSNISISSIISSTEQTPTPCRSCDKTHVPKASKCRTRRWHPPVDPADKRYQCAYCEKSFAQLNDKIEHQRVHVMGRKPFRCAYCAKSFPYFTLKIWHERTHSGEKTSEQGLQQSEDLARASDS